MLASFASSFALLFAHLHGVLAQWWFGQTKHLGQSFALSAGQQAGLRAHVYRSVDASWLDANLMHKYVMKIYVIF
jgi:hypothetical protein